MRFLYFWRHGLLVAGNHSNQSSQDAGGVCVDATLDLECWGHFQGHTGTEQDEDEGARRRWRSKTKMKEQDEYEGARRIWRSKTKMKEQDEYEGARRIWRSKTKMKEQDKDEGARRIWRSKTMKMKELDEDEVAIRIWCRVAQSEFRKILRFRVVAEKVHSTQPQRFTRRARNTASLESGGGGFSSRTQYEKIRRFVQKSVFFP